jgi:restriction system protein
MSKKRNIPKGMPAYRDLINPTIMALQSLGGSGTVDEIYNAVLKIIVLPDEIVDFQHSEKSSQSEIQYRLAWARTYLKNYGIIDNSSRSVWVILPQHKEIESVDVDDCVNKVRSLFGKKADNTSRDDNNLDDVDIDLPEEIKPWRTKLHNILLNMNPYAFERLTQRLLRESGFTQVVVTKKSGDGGIDGFGKLMINGLLGFKVAFQCKRYSGTVPAGDIRDFRGSLTTDIEKALFITTGSFSNPAKEEAITSGKIQIELIDGEELINRLAEYQIGLKPVIDYDIDEVYFSQI